jgi:hypothetical protein
MFREDVWDKKKSESAEIRDEFHLSAHCTRTDISRFWASEIIYSSFLIYYPNPTVSQTGSQTADTADISFSIISFTLIYHGINIPLLLTTKVTVKPLCSSLRLKGSGKWRHTSTHS